ncbi:aspartyl/asparaginyl beta-hydroxylase domain-containing protein [Legionella septentrionalis]|uniref:aspartyl/asparaginyl beta-hydroxylase domain-containing protein n=1 Tax=Legionella septentrionalis TaxID=2498109 RepID=UPI000F8E2887|nr:aspartyl/asparaginyl beta-hydroxylase domain-containing protein [Legionella septentrionalis]RUQ94633.1 aspartyl/asparaginyl beta-hydroxylase domain-containing protein [Legionella septentrionalis]
MAIRKKLSLKLKVINYIIKKPLEFLITHTSKVQGKNFYDIAQFPWIKILQQSFTEICNECINVAHPKQIPNIQDVLSQETPIAWDENWKVYFIYFFWHLVKEHSENCPKTTTIIKQIPGVVSAFFSILAPGREIPEHHGPYNGVLRCHLGLIIPKEQTSGLKVGEVIEHWIPGKVIIFDDTQPHSAWNHSVDEYRVVLFIDFLRPLPYPVHLLNKLFYQFLSTDKDIQEGLDYLKNRKLTLAKIQF